MTLIYPPIKSKEFYNKINKIFKKYKISKSKKSFEEFCYPKKYELQVQQQFLADYINVDTPYNGLLVYHKIGSGKTCTAIQIAENWKEKRKIIVVLPASLIGNFIDELMSDCCTCTYITKKEKEILKQNDPTSDEYKEIIEISKKRIYKVYNIYSYNKFITLIEKKNMTLENSLLIIDEVQNMVSIKGKYYNILYNKIYNTKNIKIVLLSATPIFDKPMEIALTMNLLKIPFQLPIGKEFERMFLTSKVSKKGDITLDVKNLNIFKERIKGYVSFYLGAPEYTYPQKFVKYVKCEMSAFQYNAYKIVSNNEIQKKNNKKIKSILDLQNDFFIGTRMMSNIVFPNNKTDTIGFESLTDSLILKHLDRYSIKMSKIMKKIKTCKGKIFIYSTFRGYGGIKSLIKVLTVFGYKDYATNGTGKNRFAIWSGDESFKYKEEIKSIFNTKENINGKNIKIILGSPSIKEGVSLNSIRQVHILEPYWNFSRIEQVIGRAVRFCSHKFLPIEERFVKVYIYIATHPDENKTVDEHILNMAIKKEKITYKFEKALKETAIDCTLFKNANDIHNELECVK